MKKRSSALPLILGLLAAVLLLAVLWPKEPPQKTVLVAASDLGAGQTLTAADLVSVKLPAAQAPADALTDVNKVAGQTLAVVRYKGEPIAARHLGQAVTLAATERGIAIKVKADTGLAGILRPGMKVGVIATLGDRQNGQMYAKTTLEGLRVLYVSPDFQARPYAPATASGTVKSGGALDGGTANTGNAGTVREGVLVLAASTQPVALRYEQLTASNPLTATQAVTATTGGATPADPAPKLTAPAANATPDPNLQWVTPVELLAALNAAGDSLTLTLLPPEWQSYTTVGLFVSELARPADMEAAK